MDRIAQLDQIVAQFDLNTHSFYTDWRAGTLPKEKLADYADEYKAFVSTIAVGWETLGQTHYAQEEREHDALWDQFRTELGVDGPARRPQTHVLAHSASTLFAAGKAEAIGALYAFEAQQPNTSRSKLDGLKEHYGTSEKGAEYFAVHADDLAEAELLRKLTADLSDAEFARALSACTVVCSAMWGALDGIYHA
jgi:pyrroloquinoline-quinone synthase